MALRAKVGQSAAGCSFVETVVAPMAGPPLHFHTATDEVFHVLEGELAFVCDGQRSTLRAGDMLVASRGCRHAFRNFSGKPARMLVTVTPSGFEAKLFAMSDRAPSPAELEAGIDLQIVGPPMEAPDTISTDWS